MFTIHADLRITRRKLFHVVADASGAVRYRNREIGPCLAWVKDEGQASVILLCDPDRPGEPERQYRVTLAPETEERAQSDRSEFSG